MAQHAHRDARLLLTSRRAGVLSTVSVEVEGYPFGSVVPYCLDRRGRPILLISEIAQHTRNLDADPRACLTVQAAAEDVQAAARLSMLVRAVRTGEDLEDAAERYYRHFPESRGHHQAHSFAFHHLEPARLRWIGGFGDIRWIEPQEIDLANPFTREQETAIVEHMNQDHADAMRSYCRRIEGLEIAGDEEVVMCGIDADGFDLRAAGRRVRLAFEEPVANPAEARQRLVALAR